VKPVHWCGDTSEAGNVTNKETVKPAQHTAALASVSIYLVLYCLIYIRNNGEQQFIVCVDPCSRYLAGRDTHNLCVACLDKKHAQSALEGCYVLPMRTLCSRLAFFCEDAQARVPQGTSPAAKAQWRLQTWALQMALYRRGPALSLPSPDRSSAFSRVWKHALGFPPPWLRHRHC